MSNAIQPTALWRFGTILRGQRALSVLEVDGSLYELDALLEGTGVNTPHGGTGVRAILERWDDWRPMLSGLAEETGGGESIDRETLRWLPSVPDPRKLICGGANYRDHLAEMGHGDMTLPRPFAFVKPVNTLLGHGETLRLPAMAKRVDWEAELAVVIGRRAKGVRGAAACAAIAGYVPFNDISARDWIDEPIPGVGMDWILHKSFDGFSPLGPLITPAEFIEDPQDLEICLTVNGLVKQDSSTAKMIFGVQQLIEHLATVMTLEPGDVIATGSPAGVGHARGEYLQPGDDVVVSVSGLGDLLTRVGEPT